MLPWIFDIKLLVHTFKFVISISYDLIMYINVIISFDKTRIPKRFCLINVSVPNQKFTIFPLGVAKYNVVF